MLRTRILAAASAVIIAASAATPAFAADVRAAGREGMAKHGPAVVTISIVQSVSYSFGGDSANDQEFRNEVTGTIIGADGLTIVPLEDVDPASTFQRRMARRMGNRTDVKFEANIKDLKIILDDSTEIDAQVVYRDPDLEIAFIRPKEKPAQPMPFVDMKGGAKPEVFDAAYSLGRLGKIARRSPIGMTGEIQAIVTKPREYFVPSGELASSGSGIPVFSAEGKPLGILSTRYAAEGQEEGQSSMMIVLPAAEVVEAAAQAPEKPAAEPDKPKADAEPKAETKSEPKTETKGS